MRACVRARRRTPREYTYTRSLPHNTTQAGVVVRRSLVRKVRHVVVRLHSLVLIIIIVIVLVLLQPYSRRCVLDLDPPVLVDRDCAYGLARYAAIAQNAGLVPIVEPEILLDGDHDIDRTLEVAEATWAETFKYMMDNGVMMEGILLKPSMVTPGAECPRRSNPEEVADYTLKMLNRRVPPAVPGIMFLSGGQSELEATLNLNAMNQTPNPWHVSFSYARALQNSVLKTWKGEEANVEAAQAALIQRASANSAAQLGKYTADGESAEAAKGMVRRERLNELDRYALTDRLTDSLTLALSHSPIVCSTRRATSTRSPSGSAATLRRRVKTSERATVLQYF